MIFKREKNSSSGQQDKLEKGGRNLVLLGIGSTVVALLTVGISLMIYHNSGDIYLDRSRPGFLPDEEEIEEEEIKDEEDYELSKDEKISKELLKEYLDNLEFVIEDIDSYEKPFGEEILSDKHLGIETGE